MPGTRGKPIPENLPRLPPRQKWDSHMPIYPRFSGLESLDNHNPCDRNRTDDHAPGTG